MKTIVFDYDGVILDSFPTVLKVLGKLHQKYHLPVLTKELLVQLFDENFWESHEKLGLSNEEEKKLKEEMKQALKSYQSEMSIFQGMKDVLKKFSSTHEIIILSSNYAETIMARLQEEGLQNAVTTVLGTETPGNKREKMEQILQTKKSLIFITDTRGDLLEIKDLDITTIAVTWGFHDEERLSQAEPTEMVSTPQELTATLKKLSLTSE